MAALKTYLGPQSLDKWSKTLKGTQEVNLDYSTVICAFFPCSGNKNLIDIDQVPTIWLCQVIENVVVAAAPYESKFKKIEGKVAGWLQ